MRKQLTVEDLGDDVMMVMFPFKGCKYYKDGICQREQMLLEEADEKGGADGSVERRI